MATAFISTTCINLYDWVNYTLIAVLFAKRDNPDQNLEKTLSIFYVIYEISTSNSYYILKTYYFNLVIIVTYGSCHRLVSVIIIINIITNSLYY